MLVFIRRCHLESQCCQHFESCVSCCLSPTHNASNAFQDDYRAQGRQVFLQSHHTLYLPNLWEQRGFLAGLRLAVGTMLLTTAAENAEPHQRALYMRMHIWTHIITAFQFQVRLTLLTNASADAVASACVIVAMLLLVVTMPQHLKAYPARFVLRPAVC